MAYLVLFRDSFLAYTRDRSIIYAAGLAYYAVFAIAPLLVMSVWLASLFVGRSDAAAQIATQAENLVGPQLAAFLGELARALSERTFSTGATVLSVAGLLLSGAAIFNQLDVALNDIWGIRKLPPQGLRDRMLLLRRRITPLIIVFFLGLLLSFSVTLDTLASTLAAQLARFIPRAAELQPHVGRLIVPLLAFLTFTVIIKWLPEAHARWRDVAVGGLLTTLLFMLGRGVLAYTLARNSTISLYGTAGSVVALLIWVYYSAQILLFGAEFTKLYADRFGEPIVPRRLAGFEAAVPFPAEQTAPDANPPIG